VLKQMGRKSEAKQEARRAKQWREEALAAAPGRHTVEMAELMGR
jgi:hypothetical protein